MVGAAVFICALMGAGPEQVAKPDVYADTPPPTAYDLAHQEKPNAHEDKSLTHQVGRTLLALVFVLCLIYLLGKVVLPKVFQVPQFKGPSKILKVHERVLLDGKNALYLVDVGAQRMLIHAGPQGVGLITHVQPHTQEPGVLVSSPNMDEPHV